MKLLEENSVRPLSLKHSAASIARNYGDSGAIVITSGKDGVRIGVHGLSDKETQEALCVAIHYSFVMMNKG